MAKAKQCESMVIKGNGVGNQRFGDGDWEIVFKIQKLIILQLNAVSPASLPFSVIFRGVVCECADVRGRDVSKILEKLVRNNLVLCIGECGFGDKFILIEPATGLDGGGTEWR